MLSVLSMLSMLLMHTQYQRRTQVLMIVVYCLVTDMEMCMWRRTRTAGQTVWREEEDEEGLAHGRRTTEGERERGREQSRSERGRHDGWLRLTRNSLSRNCLSQNACLGKLGALVLTAVPPPPCLSFCPLYLPYFYFSSSYSVYYSIPHHEQTASSPHCDGSNREWHWHSSPQPAPSHRGPPILSNGKER